MGCSSYEIFEEVNTWAFSSYLKKGRFVNFFPSYKEEQAAAKKMTEEVGVMKVKKRRHGADASTWATRVARKHWPGANF